MANSTTINGYNSGLDIKNIVSTLVAAEKAPKEAQLKRLESDTTAKFTGIGQLQERDLRPADHPQGTEQARSCSRSARRVPATRSSPPPPRPRTPCRVSTSSK